MAWTILLFNGIFYCFKNLCKITSRKKSSLTSPLRRAPPGVKRPFLSKKCIFRAENDIFSKSSFYTKMFSDQKYSFSVGQKYFFVISKKVNIFQRIEPSYIDILSSLNRLFLSTYINSQLIMSCALSNFLGFSWKRWKCFLI